MRSAVFVLAATAVGCVALPRHPERPASTAILDAATPLRGALASAMAAHPGASGFVLFDRGEAAIQARVALAEVAQSSLDAQYFEWAGDRLGRVLIDRVLAAADRGVRVRLLIDDYTNKGKDLGFETLDAHPNIEVRVFNPFARGRMRLPQFIGRWTELNHRMHNKMFVVDGIAAIVGGRNLTEDYFGLGGGLDFRDFDLLAVGPVVPAAEHAFDQYWNSEWAYPITALRKPSNPRELRAKRARFDAHVAGERATFPYRLPRGAGESLGWIAGLRDRAVWAPAEVVYDDPRRMAEPVRGAVTAVGRAFVALARQATREIVGENAYLVPHADLRLTRELLARGVELRLLTNSLATTDVIAVNAAYAKSRPHLVDVGVSLYEMKPYAGSRSLYIANPASRAHLALHGKAAVFDRKVVFLGSFNLDPRSMYLDTEAVFVVHSRELAQQLLQAFATDFDAANAWHIGRVVGKRKSAWLTERATRVDVEPHDPASVWRRMVRALASLLPVRPYL
jgi:putative cardiolipin synthase